MLNFKAPKVQGERDARYRDVRGAVLELIKKHSGDIYFSEIARRLKASDFGLEYVSHAVQQALIKLTSNGDVTRRSTQIILSGRVHRVIIYSVAR